jgi:hypothetical protein
MRIIVQERSIRQLSILSVRLPVDADAQVFFIDTNQSFLHDWVNNCYLHVPIFRVLTP